MSTCHNYEPEISEKRLAANRANALRSTGPKTEEGKTRSSFNAFRHGLTGQVSAVTEEDRAAEAKFTAPIVADLKPEGAVEQQIAIAIAQGHWRLSRVRAMEDNIFAVGHFGPAGNINVDNAELHSALTAAQVFLDRSKDFERLTLYEQRIQKGVEKNMRELEALQTKRLAARQQALEEAAKLTELADFTEEEQPIGFDFSNGQIRACIDRKNKLERHKWHENVGWDPEFKYPRAA